MRFTKQQAKIIIKKMKVFAEVGKDYELAEILEIKPGSMSGIVSSGKIPDRWFETFEEKYRVTKTDLLKDLPQERSGSISEYSYREAKLPENQPTGTQAAETEYSPRASREEFSKLASQRLMRMVNWLYDEFDGNMMQLDSWLDDFYRNLYKNDYAYHKWWREQSESTKKPAAGRSNDIPKAAGDG